MKQANRIAGLGRDRKNAEKDDFTPTPPGAVTALLDRETFTGPVWECACGDGAISELLKARGYDVVSTDLVDRGYGESRVDFLMETAPRAPNIVTNPPFKLASPFILKALSLATGKVAMFLPLAYLSGVARHQGIWSATPIRTFYVFSNRVQMKRGGWDGGQGGGGMINFMWAVWEHGFSGRPSVEWVTA